MKYISYSSNIVKIYSQFSSILYNINPYIPIHFNQSHNQQTNQCITITNILGMLTLYIKAPAFYWQNITTFVLRRVVLLMLIWLHSEISGQSLLSLNTGCMPERPVQSLIGSIHRNDVFRTEAGVVVIRKHVAKLEIWIKPVPKFTASQLALQDESTVSGHLPHQWDYPILCVILVWFRHDKSDSMKWKSSTGHRGHSGHSNYMITM